MEKRIVMSSIIFVILSSSIAAYAQDKKSTNTIPFATYNLEPSNNPELKCYPRAAMATKNEITDIPADEIESLVKKIKNDVCSSIAPGTIEVWIGIGAEQKAIVVNSHFNAGMKVTFECK